MSVRRENGAVEDAPVGAGLDQDGDGLVGPEARGQGVERRTAGPGAEAAHRAHDIDLADGLAAVVAALDLDRLEARAVDYGDHLGAPGGRAAGADPDAVAGLAEFDLGREDPAGGLFLDRGLEGGLLRSGDLAAAVDDH